MNEEGALLAFSALSSQTRLRILKTLVQAGSEGLTAGDIAQEAEATPSRASFHLSSLSDAGLVTATRRSRRIIYTVNFEAIGGLMRYVLEDCCKNNPTVRGCCG